MYWVLELKYHSDGIRSLLNYKYSGLLKAALADDDVKIEKPSQSLRIVGEVIRLHGEEEKYAEQLFQDRFGNDEESNADDADDADDEDADTDTDADADDEWQNSADVVERTPSGACCVFDLD